MRLSFSNYALHIITHSTTAAAVAVKSAASSFAFLCVCVCVCIVLIDCAVVCCERDEKTHHQWIAGWETAATGRRSLLSLFSLRSFTALLLFCLLLAAAQLILLKNGRTDASILSRSSKIVSCVCVLDREKERERPPSEKNMHPFTKEKKKKMMKMMKKGEKEITWRRPKRIRIKSFPQKKRKERTAIKPSQLPYFYSSSFSSSSDYYHDDNNNNNNIIIISSSI